MKPCKELILVQYRTSNIEYVNIFNLPSIPCIFLLHTGTLMCNIISSIIEDEIINSVKLLQALMCTVGTLIGYFT